MLFFIARSPGATSLASLAQHCGGITVNNKTLLMKATFLIILVTLSTAVFSQTTAKRDSITDSIVRGTVTKLHEWEKCDHASSREFYVLYSDTDTIAENRYLQQWLWAKQCNDCLFNQYRFDMIYWHYTIKEE
jgi:hypothetical protein